MTDPEQTFGSWLDKQLHAKLIHVWFLDRRSGEWFDEKHVNDPVTLTTTIDMTASRIGARAAVWRDDPGGSGSWWAWVFLAGDRLAREFPTRESAEMYAIHVRQ